VKIIRAGSLENMQMNLNKINAISYYILISVSGLILPLVLMPVITLTGYSEIVEEIAKALVIFFIVLKLPLLKQKIWAVVLFGFLFGLSESIFYLNNIFQVGDFGLLWQRLLWIIPVHISTVLIIILPALKDRKWIFLGLASAIILHIIFNIHWSLIGSGSVGLL